MDSVIPRFKTDDYEKKLSVFKYLNDEGSEYTSVIAQLLCSTISNSINSYLLLALCDVLENKKVNSCEVIVQKNGIIKLSTPFQNVSLIIPDTFLKDGVLHASSIKSDIRLFLLTDNVFGFYCAGEVMCTCSVDILLSVMSERLGKLVTLGEIPVIQNPYVDPQVSLMQYIASMVEVSEVEYHNDVVSILALALCTTKEIPDTCQSVLIDNIKIPVTADNLHVNKEIVRSVVYARL